MYHEFPPARPHCADHPIQARAHRLTGLEKARVGIRGIATSEKAVQNGSVFTENGAEFVKNGSESMQNARCKMHNKKKAAWSSQKSCIVHSASVHSESADFRSFAKVWLNRVQV